MFSDKFIRNLGWSSISTIASSLALMLQYAILARFLTPDEFGVVTASMIIILFIQIFQDAGLAKALIQTPNLDPDLLSSILLITVALSFFISTIIYFLAPQIAAFFSPDTSSLTQIVQLLVISFFIGSLGSTYSAVLQKNMLFKSIAIARISSVTVSLILCIICVYNGVGVYSLVLASVGQATVHSVIVCHEGIVGSSRPTLVFSIRKIQTIAKFGTYQIFERILDFAGANVEKIFITAFLGTANLGYYQLAWMIAIFPVIKIIPIVIDVLYPEFCSIRDNTKKKAEIYLKVLELNIFIWMPIFLILTLKAELIVKLVLGPSYEYVGDLLPYLAIASFLKILSPIGGALLLSEKRADITFYWNLVSLFVINTCIYTVLIAGGSLVDLVLFIMLISCVMTPVWHFIISKFCNVRYNSIYFLIIRVLFVNLSTFWGFMYLVEIITNSRIVSLGILLVLLLSYYRWSKLPEKILNILNDLRSEKIDAINKEK